jgi:CheY-like chemotaxis protein
MTTDNSEIFSLIMIEDDEGHAHLIEKNLRRAGIGNPLLHLSDGNQAIQYFFENDRLPLRHDKMLILLDLNLPGIDGYEILKRLKSDAHTRIIPIIILTTTSDQKEIDRCYQLGCNVYMTKPVEYEQFSAAIRQLGLMLAVVKIPDSIK